MQITYELTRKDFTEAYVEHRNSSASYASGVPTGHG